MNAKDIAEQFGKTSWTKMASIKILADTYLDLLVKQEGKVLIPEKPTEEERGAFIEVWFQTKWPDYTVDPAVDAIRFNAAIKAMIAKAKEE